MKRGKWLEYVVCVWDRVTKSILSEYRIGVGRNMLLGKRPAVIQGTDKFYSSTVLDLFITVRIVACVISELWLYVLSLWFPPHHVLESRFSGSRVEQTHTHTHTFFAFQTIVKDIEVVRKFSNKTKIMHANLYCAPIGEKERVSRKRWNIYTKRNE